MSVDETDSDGTEFDERYFDLLAAGAAVAQFAVLALVGEFALESLTYGAVAGLFLGVGSYLFLPWFLRLQTLTEAADEPSIRELVDRVEKSAQRGVLGLGLELGSIAMLAVGFGLGDPDLVVGSGTGVLVALVVYFLGSVVLRR